MGSRGSKRENKLKQGQSGFGASGLGKFLKAASVWIGAIGGALGIVSFFHGLEVEKRIERRSCIGDLSSYPAVMRSGLQHTTTSLFVWVQIPSLENRRNLKENLAASLAQIQIATGHLIKYECNSPELEVLNAQVEMAMNLAKTDESNDVDINSYSSAVDGLVEASSFSDQCCIKIK